MNLILFGFKNCGKTYFGKLLAKELGLSYIDTDALIESLSGMSCARLYKTAGKAAFREIEKEAIQSLQKSSEAIIGVGGGAVLEACQVEFLKKIGRLVYLEADKELLKNRMLHRYVLPAYIDPQAKEASFEEMYRTRLPIYESIEAARVNIMHKSNEAVLKELKEIYYGK